MQPPRHLILGTAGHIDHGKTSLVRALTGVDTDRLPAERQRGITIDLGFASLDLGDGLVLGLVDVPGHERFIRNMLAGAAGFDLALLVVAADDSVMPQTREHLEILNLLGVTSAVVALTKSDLAHPSWAELVEEEIRSLLAGTPLARAEIIRTSTVTGAGIDDLRSALARAARALPPRPDPGLFHMAIDRSFSLAGHGTVVTGTITSGQVAVGDALTLLPEDRGVRVRGLHHHDQPAERLTRGSRAAINLAGVHHTEVHRGMALASPGFLLPSRILSVSLRTLPDAPRPLRHRQRYRLHLGTGEYAASLSLLDGPELAPGSSGTAQLLLEQPVAARHGQPFVLRAESPPQTLGGGLILQPVARRIRRRDSTARSRLERLLDPDPLARAQAVLAARGLQPWSSSDLVREAGLSLDHAQSIADTLAGSGLLVPLPIGPRRCLTLWHETVSELEDRVRRALLRLHSRNPRAAVVPRLSLATELADLDNDALLSALLQRLAQTGQVRLTPRTVALADFEPQLSQSERRLKEQLASALQAGGLNPPDLAALLALAGPRSAVVPDLLNLLCDEGRIVAIHRELYLDAEAEAELRHRVLTRLADGSKLTMAELRDLLGSTRKFAVPIGEYLDRIGLTLREGDHRRLSPDYQTIASSP